MAFNIDYMARVSSSANSDSLKMWVYNGTSTGSNETLATITTSNYFNSFQQNLTSGSEAGPLQVNDVILVHGNDAREFQRVTSITTNVTVADLETGAIETADIANNAVTSAKLDDVIALGASGTLGSLTMFPATAASGTLVLSPVNNSADVAVTISNASHGQASVISIPDGGAATANFCVAPAALVSGNVITASGTSGLVQDGGFSVLAKTTAAYGGGGTSNAFTATGLTSSSIVSATILASTNAVNITKAVPSTDTLTVTFSADPGASTTVNYIAITPAV